MKTLFTNTFSDSINRLVRENTWWYKTYEFFRYDIRNFVRNVWFFRKELFNYKWWDYHFTLSMFKRSIEGMYPKFEKFGFEVDETRLKKVDKMIRACVLMQNFIDNNFIEQAEKELGEVIHYDWEFEDVPDRPGCSRLVDKETDEEKLHNRKVFDRASDIEEEQWDELWIIMRGQGRDRLKSMYQQIKLNDNNNSKSDNPYDGTDLRGWWD